MRQLSRRLGLRVGVLSGSCGNQEDWIEMLNYEETCRRRKESLFSKHFEMDF